MSHDLFDLKRLKITAETRAWLQGQAIKTGKSQQEIAREALHDLSVRELDSAKVLHALDPREGLNGAGQGHRGASGGRRR